MKFGLICAIVACVAGCSSTTTTARPVITRAAARPGPTTATSQPATSPAATSPAATGTEQNARVYLATAQDIREPALFAPACAHGCQLSGDSTAYLSRMSWPTWTHQIATGTGTYEINSCEPNCATGKVYRVRAFMTLSLPVKVCFPRANRYYFSRISFKFPDGLPPALRGANAPQNPWTFTALIDQAKQSCG